MVHRSAVSLALVLAVHAGPGRPVSAQRVAMPAAAARSIAPSMSGTAALELAARKPATHERQPPKVWYVAGGALVGGAAVGVGLAAYFAGGGECICTPLAFAPAVAGGMVLGAAGGYLVYRVRFR